MTVDPHTINKIQENITELVHQVDSFSETPKFENIFATDFGQRLGRQADELLNFIFKSHLLGILFGKIQSLSKVFLLSEELIGILDTSMADDNDRELIEGFRKILPHLAEDNQESCKCDKSS